MTEVTVAVPRAERSGSHRVVDVEVGDLRQVIAAIAGVATLARAQGVGPKALRDLLPELRAACVSVPSTVAGALLTACDVVALSTGLADDARAALDALVVAARGAVAEVLAAIDAVEQKGLGARTRIALQGACDQAVELLAHVRHAIELLQRASTSEPIAVAVEDLLRELDGGELGGTPVQLTLGGDMDANVAVHPRIAVGVLLGILSRVRHLAAGTSFIAISTTHEDRVAVEIRRRAPGDPTSPSIEVHVPTLASYDELVLRLAAATVAAPLEVDGRTIRLHLLRA